MVIHPLFAWYDFWVGIFWDRKARKLYILPLPCIGVVIQFKSNNRDKQNDPKSGTPA